VYFVSFVFEDLFAVNSIVNYETLWRIGKSAVKALDLAIQHSHS